MPEYMQMNSSWHAAIQQHCIMYIVIMSSVCYKRRGDGQIASIDTISQISSHPDCNILYATSVCTCGIAK